VVVRFLRIGALKHVHHIRQEQGDPQGSPLHERFDEQLALSGRHRYITCNSRNF
jgi:hypothetical protein